MIKKIIAAFFLLALTSSNSYAINIIDRIIYREVYVQSYNQRLLVGRLTGNVEYLWERPSIAIMTTPRGIEEAGEWVRPVNEGHKKMWQDIYDKERSGKSRQ